LRRCFSPLRACNAGCRSPTWVGSASSGVANVSFQRLRKPNTAIVATISTICVSFQRLRSPANISSVTSFGTEAAASAKSSVAVIELAEPPR